MRVIRGVAGVSGGQKPIETHWIISDSSRFSGAGERLVIRGEPMPRVKDWGTRKDANHNDVVQWFRDLLCKVKEVHMVPGFVDVIVKCAGKTAFVEIKDPAQIPSKRRLSDPEAQFWADWGEEPLIVETQQDVIDLVQRLRESGL